MPSVAKWKGKAGRDILEGDSQKSDFSRKFTAEMTPLKASEEAVCTGGIIIRSETENLLCCSAFCTSEC